MAADPTVPTPPDEPAPATPPQLELDRRGDVLVVRPLDVGDRTAISRIRRVVLGAGRPVILDLDHAVLGEEAELLAEDFRPQAGDEPDVRIASGRASCRRLLARLEGSDTDEVFDTVDDALHAGAAPIRTGVVVSAGDDGSLVASVDVHGHLCTVTAPTLEAELAVLIADGVTHLTIDLPAADRCAARPGGHVEATGHPSGATSANAGQVVEEALAAMADGRKRITVKLPPAAASPS